MLTARASSACSTSATLAARLFGNSPGAQAVIVRVFYDAQTAPAIEMPLMDFLGDIQCQSALFNTVYFTKVKHSHNFRLPMPFRKHITIELENPSAENLAAYTDVQWEKVDRIPDDCGYLRTDYRSGVFQASKPLVLCQIDRPATIVAHWLQYESEKSVRGEQLCEGDHQIFLDGDEQPDPELPRLRRRLRILLGLPARRPIGRPLRDHQAGGPEAGRIARGRPPLPGGRCHPLSEVLPLGADLRERSGRRPALGASPIPYRHCVYYYAKD